MAQITDETQAVAVPGEFGKEATPPSSVPAHLQRATARLQFPPSYVVVGVYRLITDKNLYVPAWQKCKHGVQRGLSVGIVWAAMTFHVQRQFVGWFWMKSPRVTGLTDDTFLGYQMPFDLRTYATLMFISSQMNMILYFFLSRNIRIARERVWLQTLESRGKGPDFWKPYVEEWDVPPRPQKKGWGVGYLLSGTIGRYAAKLLLLPFDFVPFVGLVVTAYLRALGTARYLHQPYFEAKRMTADQTSVFMQERKWDYRAFGFTAAILERLPLVGLVFSISNRIGAAMWAVDLEKKQHYVAAERSKKL